jgi:hypothetical protein
MITKPLAKKTIESVQDFNDVSYSSFSSSGRRNLLKHCGDDALNFLI